jgi:hypothetical protein
MHQAEQILDATLDSLLRLMHEYASAERVGQGYPSNAPGCSLYRASRQYDHDNGASDSDRDAELGAAVSAVVDQMADPHRTCLRIEGRNISTGVRVWISARLPLCPVERSVIRQEARNQLARRLQAAGLM